MAGIVLENTLHGRRRHLWLSVSADLCVDALRDLHDIGAAHVPVYNLTKLTYGPIERQRDPNGGGRIEHGVLFCTYSALVSEQRAGGSRLDQVMQWLGGAVAEGCILFDESHKAKNLVPDVPEQGEKGVKGARGARGAQVNKKVSSKTAAAVSALQRGCPKARVVYCSAVLAAGVEPTAPYRHRTAPVMRGSHTLEPRRGQTGASDVKHMAYMERLGLWGVGTSFNDDGGGFRNFYSSISEGGVGAMELVGRLARTR